MNRYEKLILVIIALLLFSKLGALGRDVLLAQTYGTSPIPYEAKRNWEIISLLVASALNLGVGVWLFLEAAKENLNRWVWTIFGLFFGIMGLAIFYLVQIFTVLKGQQKT